MKSGLLALIGFALIIPAIPLLAFAQGGLSTPMIGGAGGTITVYVRDEFGEPLTVTPKINIREIGMAGSPPNFPQIAGDGWVFTNLPTGQDYQVAVEAEGYQTTYEGASLPPFDNATSIVIVYMKPIGQKNEFHKPKGQFVLAPRTEKEVERGLKDLRSRKFDSAEKHLAKALQMAPGNPYVNYVMGMIYLTSKQLPQAKPYLEKSVSIDPRQPPSLLALGSVRFQLGDYPGAIQVLEQDVRLDATSWKADWMLADSYLRQRNYAKGREYAEQALKTGKGDAAPAQLLLGEALAGLGDREEAIATLEKYLQAHPKDPNIAKFQSYVEALRNPPSPLAKAVAIPVASKTNSLVASVPSSVPAQPKAPLSISAPAPPVGLPPKENWAPPDIDSVKPFVISGAACSLPKVMQAAAKNALEFVNSLQQFSATEEYESVEIKRNEQLESPETRKFSYLVTVDEPRPHMIQLNEIRNAGLVGGDMPGMLADMGAPGLALAFHPIFRDDFDWKCEGIGEWKDKPAWVIHFEQRADRPTSLLEAYETPHHEYALPLKGRAWVSQKEAQVVHLDTDLVHPMTQIGLMREHFSIDYEPVSFQAHNVQLWLPENVDVYYQFKGHFLHHYHHYTNFKLFWVGSTQKISKPKETNPQR
jgi:tetratricopeptide (TPR) repeat protein